jgi:hypothetical protein
MDIQILYAIAITVALALAVFVPYFYFNIRGKRRGHTWFTWWKPRGHSDIGPDMGGPRLTRHDADDARGARY